jgi:hypothetical protein
MHICTTLLDNFAINTGTIITLLDNFAINTGTKKDGQMVLIIFNEQQR